MELQRLLACLVLVTISLGMSYAQVYDCTEPADIFFVIDGSDSLENEDFNASKVFVIDVLSELDVSRGNVHVGANVFGTEVYDTIQLHGPTIYPLFLRRMYTMMRAPYGNTATNIAIREMREDFGFRALSEGYTSYSNNIDGVQVGGAVGSLWKYVVNYQDSWIGSLTDTGNYALNGRPGVTKLAVVITDGRSISSELTAQEAQQARASGINMIAIGSGSNIVESELIGIAGDVSRVFITPNVTELVNTIQNAIKEIICTRIGTTTPAPTTTTGPTQPSTTMQLGNDFDCPDCMISSDHGFQPNDRYCQKYYEIIGDGNGGLRKISRKCRDGLFWHQYHLSCKRPEQVNCPNDPCRDRRVASYAIDGLCSGYVACVGGRSFWACCDVIQRYVPGSGCVTDPSCNDACDNSQETNLQGQTECRFFSDPSNPAVFIEVVPYHGNLTRRCAPGTIFDELECVCVHNGAPPSGNLDDCNPAANLTFDDNLNDSSGHFYAGSEFVTIQNSQAVFRGNGMVNIHRFSGDDFGTSLVMRFRFFDVSGGNGEQALVSNCVYSSNKTSTVSITTSGRDIVFFADTEVENATVRIRYNPNIWTNVIYIYDGENLTGVVNGDMGQTPLSGRLKIRRSGLILGAGSNTPYFTGTFDEFQLYKCMPGFADAYRG